MQFCFILDAGVLAVTYKQKSLENLVLKSLVQLTPKGLSSVKSSSLHTLNLKGCTLMTSRGRYTHLPTHVQNLSMDQVT